MQLPKHRKGGKTAKSTQPKFKKQTQFSMWAMIKKQWFMVGVVFVIAFAFLAPWIGRKGGPLKPEYTVKYGCVFFIFFNSGLALRVSEMSEALSRLRFQAGMLSFNMLGVPFFACIAVKILTYLNAVEELILTGITVVSCMPPPVSSAVVLTRAVGGNDAAAVCASAIGSFLGLVVTPTTLLMLTGMETTAPILTIVEKLSITVVLPIILGQVIRKYHENFVIGLNLPHSLISNCLLLGIIYTTFCDTFSHEVNVSKNSLVFTLIYTICFQGFLLYTLFKIGNRILVSPSGAGKPDVICTMFCCSHKSLTMGMPLLKLMYEGSPALSVISIPLLVYHPTQILLGSLLVGRLKGWLGTATTPSGGKTSADEGDETENIPLRVISDEADRQAGYGRR